MLVFALVAASDIFPSALQGFYWRRPENNLVLFLPLLLFFKMCYFLLVSSVKDKDYPEQLMKLTGLYLLALRFDSFTVVEHADC